MPPEPLIIFLDENHCNNKQILRVLMEAGIAIERHLDHFPRGTPDEEWLPLVGKNGWALITTDARIRYRSSEKRAVQKNLVRMFYFSNNNMSGQQMATALERAIPAMQNIIAKHMPPFFASISKSGGVYLREEFALNTDAEASPQG